MSRARADTIQQGGPRIPILKAAVLEAEGQWGNDELAGGGVGIYNYTYEGNGGGDGSAEAGGSPSSAKVGRSDGGEVITHDLCGDYDDDAGGSDPSPTASAGSGATNSNAKGTPADANNNNGTTITRQQGFVYKSDGGEGSNNAGTIVNRWSIENNVALLVLKKELQIDRSAVRERRVAKKLEGGGGIGGGGGSGAGSSIALTPRAFAGSMTPRHGAAFPSMTPRGPTPRFGSTGTLTPREFSRMAGSSYGGGAAGMWGDENAFYAPPPPIVVQMTDAALLSRPLQAELELLAAKCSELESVAGIQSGEDIVGAAKHMHKRIQLLSERVVEELSNRIDVTSAAIRQRDTTRDLLANDACMSQKEMGEAYALSKVVDECFELHVESLQVIKRLHSLRMLHQEAFQRVGALSLLRAATLDTHGFISNAPDEVEEMRLGTKEVNGAVNESLAYFRTRLQALSGRQ